IRAVDEIYRSASKTRDEEIHKSVAVGRFFEKYHKNKAYCESVRDVGKEKYRLIRLFEPFYRGESHAYDQCERGGRWNSYDNEQKGVFERLQKIRVAQNVLIVVEANTEKFARGKIVPLLKGIYQHVDQGI
ncbi:MAG: hypothetical protein IJ947_03700, partial [Phascolarctobacterium sp.]|nr:hypothetical protein [Phascolarctobacterium sp.]